MSTKAELRSRLRAARRRLGDAERESARAAIGQAVLDHCIERSSAGSLPPDTRIAAYEPLPDEPGSVQLLVALHRLGYEVVVPITQPDADLDWARWTPTRPDRTPLGLDAIGDAGLVLVPALAVDRHGHRLGRGGGSYDRALSRVPAGVEIAALLFDGELLPAVPTKPWDLPVTAVVTPAGWRSPG